jgi:hypothetical protein
MLPGGAGPLRGVAFAPCHFRRRTNRGVVRVGISHYLVEASGGATQKWSWWNESPRARGGEGDSEMKGKHHTPEQIVGLLRQAEA